MEEKDIVCSYSGRTICQILEISTVIVLCRCGMLTVEVSANYTGPIFIVWIRQRYTRPPFQYATPLEVFISDDEASTKVDHVDALTQLGKVRKSGFER